MFECEELDITDRKAVDLLYNNLMYGTSVLTFNFQKRMVFKSLPAFIANQNLCFGEPIEPREFSEEYMDLYSVWKEKHEPCFRCTVKTVEEAIIDYEPIDFEENDKVFYLPDFVYTQFLFEDEPVNVPEDVGLFYEYYIAQESWENAAEKQKVAEYFEKCKMWYTRQHEEWKDGMSIVKRKRYETFNQQRKFYLLRDKKTVRTTTPRANAANPISNPMLIAIYFISLRISIDVEKEDHATCD